MSTNRFDRIWQLLKKATPEERAKIIDQLSDEDIIELRYRTNPYRKPIYKPKTKFLEFSYTNMYRLYERHLMMTTMVGFTYKMASEWIAEFGDKYVSEEQGDFAIELNNRYKKLYVENLERHYAKNKDNSKEDYALWLRAKAVVAFKTGADTKALEEDAIRWCRENGVVYESAYPIDVPPAESDFEEVRQQLKKEKGIKKTLQDKIRERQDQILDFLDYHFKFDPNNHIRCNYYPNYDKIMQEKLKTAEFKKTENGMLITENFEEYLIPPVDTFYSFNNYFETNYEHLRQCTDDIYGRTDFEVAIVAREVFNNEKEAEEWENKYKDDFDLSVMRGEMGGWIFVDPWKQNREVLRFDDEKTRLAKEMIEKRKEEERIGKDIMKKRANKMKGRSNKEVPFENTLNNYGTERIGDLDMQTNIYQTKMTRSRRPRLAFTSNTVALEK